MSNFQPEKDAKKVAPPPPSREVPFVTCTFRGTYYKAASRGLEREHYEETVKIPERMVRDPNRSAIGIFRDIIGPRVLAKKPGFSGVAFCTLVDSDGLPADLNLTKKIDYTGTHKALSEIAKMHTPDVKPGLYHQQQKLKHAIRLCLQDPVAFKDLQDKQEGTLSDDVLMMEELALLGYE